MKDEEIHSGFSTTNTSQWQNNNHISENYHKKENIQKYYLLSPEKQNTI